MKIVIYKVLIVCLLQLTVACTGKEQVSGPSVGTEVRYAKHFRIVQREGYVELVILQPETGKTEKRFALVKNGAEIQTEADVKRIDVPVKSMAVLSTTHIGMLDALKSLDCVKGATNRTFIANEKIRDGIVRGRIGEFGDESSLAPEKLLKRKINLVVYSGFGKEFPQERKLEQLSVFAMADYDWREEHPLGKAEWIKVFGYLTGKEQEAETYFASVEKAYKDLRKSLQQEKRQVKVLVGSLIGDIWYAPAGQSYMAHILRDAGAGYVYAGEPGTGSCQKTLEQVFRDQQEVFVWMNAGAVSLEDLAHQQARYALFDAVGKGSVYCYTHNSNYFWEMGAVNPHWLLEDVAVMTGNASGKRLHFYQLLK